MRVRNPTTPFLVAAGDRRDRGVAGELDGLPVLPGDFSRAQKAPAELMPLHRGESCAQSVNETGPLDLLRQDRHPERLAADYSSRTR